MTFVPADELTKTEREVVAGYGAGAHLSHPDGYVLEASGMRFAVVDDISNRFSLSVTTPNPPSDPSPARQR